MDLHRVGGLVLSGWAVYLNCPRGHVLRGWTVRYKVSVWTCYKARAHINGHKSPRRNRCISRRRAGLSEGWGLPGPQKVPQKRAQRACARAGRDLPRPQTSLKKRARSGFGTITHINSHRSPLRNRCTPDAGQASVKGGVSQDPIQSRKGRRIRNR